MPRKGYKRKIPVGTPTVHDKMMKLLGDKEPHTPEELLSCLADPEYGSLGTVRKAIARLRLRLEPQGMTIVCAYGPQHTRYYRLVCVACSCVWPPP